MHPVTAARLTRASDRRRTATRALPGFTLIELIVTIVILGILAALAVPAFNAVRERARSQMVEVAAASLDREVRALATLDQGSATDLRYVVEAMADLPGAAVVLAAAASDVVVTVEADGSVLTANQADVSAEQVAFDAGLDGTAGTDDDHRLVITHQGSSAVLDMTGDTGVVTTGGGGGGGGGGPSPWIAASTGGTWVDGYGVAAADTGTVYNLIHAGLSGATLDLGNSVTVTTPGQALYLVAYDADGLAQWAAEVCACSINASAGEPLVATDGTVVAVNYNTAHQSTTVAAYDTAGTQLWSQTAVSSVSSGTPRMYVNDIAVDAGVVGIAGAWFADAAPSGMLAGLGASDTSGTDSFVASLSSVDGTANWTAVGGYTSTASATGNGVVVHPDARVTLLGSGNRSGGSPTGYLTGIGTDPVSPSVFLLTLAADGSTVDASSVVGGTPVYARGLDLAGSRMVATGRVLGGSPTGLLAGLTPDADDVWVAAIDDPDVLGSAAWTYAHGDAAFNIPGAIGADSSLVVVTDSTNNGKVFTLDAASGALVETATSAGNAVSDVRARGVDASDGQPLISGYKRNAPFTGYLAGQGDDGRSWSHFLLYDLP